MTSDTRGVPTGLAGLLAEVLRLKGSGRRAEVCSRVRAFLDELDDAEIDFKDPWAPALETMASEGFLAAYELERFDDAIAFALLADGFAARIAHYSYGRARTLNNLALGYMERGEFAKADALFVQAAVLVASGADPTGLREHIESNRSALFGLRGDRQRSGRSPQLPYWPAVENSRDPTIRNNHALNKIDHGLLDEAIAEFRQILTDPMLDPVQRATVLSNLGSALHQSGDVSAAETVLSQARSWCAEKAYDGHVLAGILYVLGQIESQQGKLAESAASLKAAWDIIRRIAPASRISLLILRDLGLVRFALGDHRRARACLERGLEIYDEMRTDIATTEVEHEGLFVVCRSITEVLIWLHVHMSDPFDTLRTMQQAKARSWSARRDRAGRPDSGGIEVAPPTFDEDDVKEVVGFNGLLVEMFVGVNCTFVFVAYNRLFQAYRVDVGERELDVMVEELRARLVSGLRGLQQVRKLSDALFGKVTLNLGKLRLVIIAPDGPLWKVPIEVLSLPSGRDDRAEIGASAPVVYIPTASLVHRIYRGGGQAAGPTFLAITSDGPAGEELVGARLELQAIREVMRKNGVPVAGSGDPVAFRGPNDVGRLLRQATYVHIAAHAFADVNGAEPYIQFFDAEGGEERLLVSEIEELELTARVVVLAACHSSLGRISAGEGMVSLARAFLLAGARCVVSSLWELDDRRSANFFELLYGSILEEPTLARAFKGAKDSYLRRYGRDDTWAGLVIVGDADSLQDRYSTEQLEFE